MIFSVLPVELSNTVGADFTVWSLFNPICTLQGAISTNASAVFSITPVLSVGLDRSWGLISKIRHFLFLRKCFNWHWSQFSCWIRIQFYHSSRFIFEIWYCRCCSVVAGSFSKASCWWRGHLERRKNCTKLQSPGLNAEEKSSAWFKMQIWIFSLWFLSMIFYRNYAPELRVILTCDEFLMCKEALAKRIALPVRRDNFRPSSNDVCHRWTIWQSAHD